MDAKQTRRLNWKYYAIQFSSFGSSFAIFLYVTVILQAKGFSNTAIGITVALGSCLSIILPPLAAAFYSRTRMPLKTVVAAVRIATLISSVLLIFVEAPVALVSLIFIVISGTTNAAVSLTNALAMQFEDTHARINFGASRAAGSVGCVIMSVLTGMVAGSSDAIIAVSTALLAVTIILTLLFDRPETAGAAGAAVIPAPSSGSLKMLRYPACLTFFFVMMLSFANMGALDTYQVSVLRSVGGTDADYGFMLVLMVVLETPLMLLFKPLSKRFSYTQLMVAGFAMMMMKDIALIFADSVSTMFWIQGFNVAMIGIFSPAQVYFGNSLARTGETVSAQALFTGTAISVGRILGNLVGGVVIDSLGLHAMLIVTASYSALAIVFALVSNRLLQHSLKLQLMSAA